MNENETLNDGVDKPSNNRPDEPDTCRECGAWMPGCGYGPLCDVCASQCMKTTLSTVTRYPTGCFGIDYMGCMFFDSSFDESEIHEKLKQLRIPPNQVKWEERYFDTRYSPNDPRSYKTRKFTPLQTPNA